MSGASFFSLKRLAEIFLMGAFAPNIREFILESDSKLFELNQALANRLVTILM
jgi:hypothetical protein